MIPVCPKCQIALIILQYKDIEMDFCYRCRGVWLDTGELEELMQHTGAKVDDPFLQFQNSKGSIPRRSKSLCPRCDSSMEELKIELKEHTELTLDRCTRSHGLWFDKYELQQLLSAFPPQSGTNKTIDYLNEVFSTTPLNH